MRAVLTLLAAVVVICGWDCSKGDGAYDLAWLTIATGAGLSAASAIYDISRLRHNIQQHAATRPDREILVSPVYSPAQRALGLRFAMTF